MTVYYNENDPGAAAWLKELIRRELIPDGIVDTRSIEDVKPHEVAAEVVKAFMETVDGLHE